jgi:hypothetical protein
MFRFVNIYTIVFAQFAERLAAEWQYFLFHRANIDVFFCHLVGILRGAFNLVFPEIGINALIFVQKVIKKSVPNCLIEQLETLEIFVSHDLSRPSSGQVV